MKKIIAHIVSADKFAAGYINYMIRFSEYEHVFFVYKGGSLFNIKDVEQGTNVFVVKKNSSFLSPHYRRQLQNADKIIISGVFGDLAFVIRFVFLFLIKKIYLQFWGGDFYIFRDTKRFTKKWIRKKLLHTCIKRCGGIITLIPGDYDELSRIFPNRTAHYVASMPDDPTKKMDYSKYYRYPKGSRVLLGNSATVENCHMEALDMLTHLANENIEIVCPLSYGDKLYAGKVIEKGRVIFGDNFMPITDYMPKDRYLDLISSCSVAIFNNNRQQAMGNINMLLEMGRKIYMRENTSMWDCYRSFDIVINPASSLAKINKEELFKFDEKIAESNRKNVARKNNEYDNNWSIILNI